MTSRESETGRQIHLLGSAKRMSEFSNTQAHIYVYRISVDSKFIPFLYFNVSEVRMHR